MKKYNFTAKTLDDAITKACVELGITSDLLDYIVLEQGSNGVLGIGARPWVISAGSKEEEDNFAEEILEEIHEAVTAVQDEIKETAEKKKEEKKEKKEGRKPAFEKKPEKAPAAKAGKENKAEKAEKPAEKAAEKTGEKTAAEEIAARFLQAIFESMNMQVEIKTAFDEMLSELSVDLSGDNMGVLIGKRGQTLDSLQYLTGQVINKDSSDYIRVKLDTENYRERRKETLETLAENMAHKVKRTKHSMALEPMNPYERRIIHSALQDEKDIITRSEGEEPYRHVVVCYVKHKK